MGEQVLPYNPERDSHQAFSLWERNFGDRWLITREIFREVTEAVHYDVETRHLVVRDSSEEVLGYAVTQLRPLGGDEASLVLIIVDPARQRQGVGTKLLSAVLEGLAEEGISLVHAGARACGPFWQGIPLCLPAARAFFEKHGWEVYETSYDLIMHLGSFSVPEWAMTRIRDHGTSVGLARPHEASAILACHEAVFPGSGWFAEEIDQRGTRNIVVAREGTSVVGAVQLLFNDPCSPKWTGRQWRCFLGDDMGGLAAPGVPEPKRNRGIGTALVAEASRVLAERGVGNCFVHWTWLVDWYGRLGYRVWQEYWMARKRIAG